VTKDDTDATETDATETDATPTDGEETVVADVVEDESDAEPDFNAHDWDFGAEPRKRGLVRRMLVPLLLTVLLLASAGVATWVYMSMYRPDQQNNDDAVAARVVQAASDGTVALLSYKPDSMDKDFANARSHLTGEFLAYYTRFTTDVVTPAVKQKSVKTSASVVRKALSQLQPTSAEVLVFVNQTTVSKENPDGAFAVSSVKVGLTKIGNDWLISSFDPV
jgi:Mce-associated membrane protein